MEKIKDFILKDQKGENIRLRDFKGNMILLSFHPLAWTSVCAKQMKSIEQNYKNFLKLNTIPFGISVDPFPSKDAWAKSLKIKNLKLLSDFWPHGKFAKSINLFIEKYGFTARANIILNEKREVIFKKVYPIKKLPDIKEIINFLENYINDRRK